MPVRTANSAPWVMKVEPKTLLVRSASGVSGATGAAALSAPTLSPVSADSSASYL